MSPQAPETRLQQSSSAMRGLLSLAAIAIVVAGLKTFGEFLAPVLLAFFLAVMSYPIVDALRRWGLPRWLAVVLTLLVDISVLTGFGWLTISLLDDFGDVWPRYEGLLQNNINDLLAFAKQHQILTEADIANFRWQENLATMGSRVGGFVAATASFLANAFFVLILMVFMMAEGGSFARKLARLSGSRGPRLSYLTRTAKDVQRYLTIKTFVSAMTGLMAWGLCAWLGLDFAPLWGVVAFLLNYIPAIGSIVASIPAILVAWLTKDWVTATVVASGYFFINSLWGNLLEPMMMGRRFGISTLAVLLSVLFWGWLWGPIGAFLSVPLTMMVKVMLDHSRELSWLGELLGKEKKVPELSGKSDRWEDDPEFYGTAEGEGVASLVRRSQTQDKLDLEPQAKTG